MWETACPDWQERLKAGRSLVPDLPLFEEEAALAERVFNRLKLPDVIGQPRMVDAAGDWFRDIVRALFGSYDTETNRRMVQEFFLLVPKKNGKSSYAAAIMVVALIVNRRPNAEYLLIAPTKEIAQIAFKQAWGIIKADPELEKLFWARDNIKQITHRNSNASLQIKAADTDVITGSKSTGILVDETHEFAKKSKASEIFVEIRGALAARPDGFMIQITTQSKEPPQGVFKSELSIARKVRDGELKLPRLAVLYELPHEMAKDGGWKDEKVWPLVNPNLHRSVDIQFLRNELTTAEETGISQLALFASQHFNVEIGLGLQTDRWAGAEFWEQAADKTLTLQELIRRSEVVVIGIDGGGLDDLLGLAVLGREKGTGLWLLWSHAWAHEIVKERRKDIVSKLLDLEKERSLTFVELPGDDVAELADIVMEVEDLLPEDAAIGVDSFGVTDIVKELTRRGISEDRIVGIPQGWQLNGAIKTAERNLAGGNLKHSGLDLMAWSVGNAKVEPKGNAISITKQVSGSAKIDPLMAAFNTIVLMGKNPEAGLSMFDQMAEQTPTDHDERDDIDEAILADPRHPMWAQELAKYNRRLDLSDEDTF